MKLTQAVVAEFDRRGRRLDMEIELRGANADGSLPFKGHAAVFSKRYSVYGMWLEEFAPGAFTKTLGEADVRMLVNHDPNLVLARSKAGTLRLSEDSRGLLVEADMAPTTYAQDLAVSMGRGDVSQMSHAFRSVTETWDESGKIPVRTITEAQLFDVSVVTYPMNASTDAQLRSVQFEAMVESLGLNELEREKRDELLLQVGAGDVAPEFRSVLIGAQERLARLIPAGEEPPGVTQTDPPARSHGLDRDGRERRMRALSKRFALSL